MDGGHWGSFVKRCVVDLIRTERYAKSAAKVTTRMSWHAETQHLLVLHTRRFQFTDWDSVNKSTEQIISNTDSSDSSSSDLCHCHFSLVYLISHSSLSKNTASDWLRESPRLLAISFSSYYQIIIIQHNFWLCDLWQLTSHCLGSSTQQHRTLVSNYTNVIIEDNLILPIFVDN